MNIASKGKVGLWTRSAGGLIAGYAINHFKNIAVVVTQVPFIDPIGDMIDETVPWTSYEYFEWGNPAKNASILAAMMGYSPYLNIKSQKYPAIMVTAGFKDSRVPFWEPTKFVARLRASNHSSQNIILKVNEEGHFSKNQKELIQIYAYLLIHTGYSIP
jgi:oligopeptidase B